MVLYPPAARRDPAGPAGGLLPGRKIDAAENAHAREIENLASLPQGAPAITALRSRIIERFGELEDERAQINERLAALDRTVQQNDPGLLDALPYAAGIFAEAPARIQQGILAALQVQALYNNDDNQVTIRATLTTDTPCVIAALLNDPRTDDDSPAGPRPAQTLFHIW